MADKPVSRRWMLRSIRGASASEIERVTKRKRFRNQEAFELLAARCEELCDESPRAGIEAAKALVAFSSHISSDAQGRAACLLGIAYRRNRRYPKAHRVYEKALQLPLSERVRGQLLQGHAVVHMAEMDFETALGLVNAVIALQQGAPLGLALVIRSKAYAYTGAFALSAENATQALTLLNPKEDQRAFISAVQSIANALLARPGGSEELRAAYRLIRQVKRQLRGKGSGRYRSVAWVYLDWTEAQINGRMGSHRLALRQLEKVRETLYAAEGDCYLADALLVSIDMAVIYDMTAERKRGELECATALEIARTLRLEAEVAILSVCGVGGAGDLGAERG